MNKNHPLVLMGDIHGEWLGFLRDFILRFPSLNIIQVGDFGVGFKHRIKTAYELEKISKSLQDAGSELYVIRGNHDNPKYFQKTNNPAANITFLADYSTLEGPQGQKIQLVGGGISIDRIDRVINKSWWAYEKVNYQPELIQQCDIFISHVAPLNFKLDKFSTNPFVEVCCKSDPGLRDELKEEQVNMQTLFDLSKAPKCYFGHMHRSLIATDDQGRRYKCLDINETIGL